MLGSILITSSAVAQKEELKFSEQYNVEAGKPYTVVDGIKHYLSSDNGILCMKVRGKSWTLQTLSSETLTQKTRKEYTDMPDNADLELFDKFGDRVFVLYSDWNKEGEREQLFKREIDPATGTFLGKGEKILSVNGKVTGSLMMSGFYRFKVTDKFEMIFSEDEKHMLVQYRKVQDRKDKDGPNELGMAIFDQDLNQVWAGDVRMPYDQDIMRVMDYTLDNSGTISMVASIYGGSEEKAKKREEEDYRYELIRGGTNGATWDITPLDFASGQKLRSMTLYQESNGDLRAGGFYNKTGKGSAADGVYTCSFDASNKISNAVFHEIPTELINMYVGKRELKKNAKEEEKGEDISFSSMSLSSIFHDDDGSLLLIGEKRYVTVQCVTDSRGNTRCYDVYHADDLLVSRISSTGQLEWMKRIPKRLAQNNVPLGKTYTYMYAYNAHHIFRFDASRNVEIAQDEVPEYKGDPIIIVDRINDDTGLVEREAILNTEEVKGIRLYQLGQDRMVRTGDSEILMEAYKKEKEDILVRIQAKE